MATANKATATKIWGRSSLDLCPLSTKTIMECACVCISHLDQSIAQLSVGQFGLYLGGWLGWAIATLPSGGAQICHQGALLNCKKVLFLCYLWAIWLILGWVVRVGHSYLATKWWPNRPPGGAPRLSEQQEHGQITPVCVQAVSPENTEWACNVSDGQMAPFCVHVIQCEWNEWGLLKALNERAMRGMGKWCLSACVVLCRHYWVSELHERSEPSWWLSYIQTNQCSHACMS